MSALRIIIGVVFALVLIAFAILVDIFWAFIGGIEEIIRGFQAAPHSGHDIAFGLLRVCVLGGVGTVAAGVLAVVVFTALYVTAPPKPTMSRTRVDYRNTRTTPSRLSKH